MSVQNSLVCPICKQPVGRCPAIAEVRQTQTSITITFKEGVSHTGDRRPNPLGPDAKPLRG